MNILKYNIFDSAGSSRSSSGIILNYGNSESTTLQTRYIWGQPFDGTQDVSGALSNVSHINMSGDLNMVGSESGIYNAGFIQTTGLIRSETAMEAPVFRGDLEAQNASINTLTANGGTITTLSGTSLNYDEGYIENLVTEYLESSNITTEYLTVTKQAHFFELIIDQIKSAGGAVILSPADGFKIDKVVTQGSLVRLFWKCDDGTRYRKNMWRVNDQALCQTFNVTEGLNQNVSNKYWWALVVQVGTQTISEVDYNYIVVSKSTCDGTLDAEVGDEVVMLGYRGTDDVQRQSAIYISAYESVDQTLTPPFLCHYKGINDFDLKSHKYSWFAANGNTIRGSLYVESGESVQDAINASSEGRQVYLHVAYSNSANGQVDFSKQPGNYAYMGTCSNYQESDVSLTYLDYQWVRIKGDDGQAAPTVEISGEICFKYSYGYTGTPNSIELTATPYNCSPETYTWYCKNNSTWLQCGTEQTVTLEADNLVFTNNTALIKVETDNGLEDYQTVYKIADGSQGVGGITVVVSNDSFNFQGTTSSVVPNQTQQVIVRAYQGTDPISVDYSEITTINGTAPELYSSSGRGSTKMTLTFKSKSATSVSGQIRLNIIAGGGQFQKDITWSTSLIGATGGSGQDAEHYELSPTVELARVYQDGTLAVSLVYQMLHTTGTTIEKLTPGTDSNHYKLAFTAVSSVGISATYDMVANYSSSTYNGNIQSDYLAVAAVDRIVALRVYMIKGNVDTTTDPSTWNPVTQRYVKVIMDPGATLRLADNLEIKVQGHTKTLNSHTNSISTLTQNSNSFGVRIDSLTTNVNSLNSDVESLNSGMTTTTEQIAELQLSDNQMSSKITRLESGNLVSGQFFVYCDGTLTYNEGVYTAQRSNNQSVMMNSNWKSSMGKVILSLYAEAEKMTIRVYRRVDGNITNEIVYTATSLYRTSNIEIDTGEGDFCISLQFISADSDISVTVRDVILSPSTATSSLIRQTADRIMLAVDDVNIAINNQEIILDGDTKIEGELQMTNENCGIILSGKTGCTEISAKTIGTFDEFCATTETQHLVNLFSMGPGLSNTYTLVAVKEIGQFSDGELLTFVNPYVNVNSTVSVDNLRLAGVKIELQRQTNNTWSTIGTWEYSANTKSWSNSESHDYTCQGTVTLRLTFTVNGTYTYNNVLPVPRQVYVYMGAGMTYRRPISNSYLLIGYDGMASNFGEFRNVYIGSEGTYFQYGQNNKLRICDDGLQKYAGTEYAYEWTNINSLNTRLITNYNSNVTLQEHDEMIVFQTYGTMNLGNPSGNNIGRKILLSKTLPSTIKVTGTNMRREDETINSFEITYGITECVSNGTYWIIR